MFLSRRLLGPPKSPRNVFFPWFNFIMAKTGTYLEPNRAAFRVPVHLTKPEIQNYLREIYKAKVIKVNTYIKLPMIRRNSFGDYYKNGTSYKMLGDFRERRPEPVGGRSTDGGSYTQKAIVTFEETIPDDVKMVYNSKQPWMNPALTKYEPCLDDRRREPRQVIHQYE
eukprot:g20506.t1